MSQRLFFALWPERGVCEQLLCAAAPLLQRWRGRALLPTDLHVTVCFLGATPEERIAPLCERAAQLRAPEFDLHFDRLVHWSGSRTLVAVGAEAAAPLLRFAAQLSALAGASGLRPDSQPLRPHITLMRSVAALGASDELPHSWPLAPLTLHASRWYLAQSHELAPPTSARVETARYRLIADWPLQRASTPASD